MKKEFKMKKTKTAIAILSLLATIGAAKAVETTTTTTQYSQSLDESSTSSLKTILPMVSSDREINRALNTKINSYDDLRSTVSSSVLNGVVKLNGIVDRNSQKDFVVMITESIPGVVRIENLISVR
jgi:osmotically-inducible protein OsmY